MYLLSIDIWLHDLSGKKKNRNIGHFQRRIGTRGKGGITACPLYLSHFVPYECFTYSELNL